MTYTPDSPHPQHPHHLECPRCGKHTVVVRGETRYACLNCNWWRDLNRVQLDDVPILIALFITALVVLMSVLPGPTGPNGLVPILPDEDRPSGVVPPSAVG